MRAWGWPRVSVTALTAGVALWSLVVSNLPFWQRLQEVRPIVSPQDFFFQGSVALLAFLAINLFLTPFAFRPIVKPALIVVLSLAALAAYFIDTYGIYIDKVMIRNVFETDPGEAAELLTVKLLLYILAMAVLPGLIVWRMPVAQIGFTRELLHKLGVLAFTVAGVGAIAAGFYQDQASFLRNHREMRHLLVPFNYLSGIGSYVMEISRPKRPYEAIGADARPGPRWTVADDGKPVVLVLVVGETARAANASLGGYARLTMPELAKVQNLTYFSDVSSCGTSTAISVPCMFSDLGRAEFSAGHAAARDSLLDVLQRAGFEVVWYGNNSGCKGVCDKIGERRPDSEPDAALCRKGLPCFDEILLRDLERELQKPAQRKVVVLHLIGSHGPGYHLRYPAAFERYTPACKQVDFSKCSVAEIVNAYDNTMLYTDHVLARAINLLDARAASLHGALWYVSDHGESLGENGVFLHALPYAIAPDLQTRVPMVFWQGQGFERRLGVDSSCVAANRHRPISHDHWFHSVLGLLDVITAARRAELDVFGNCRR
jgi:lipid A ethanolaminephosphotransferase